jgi:hypothetical protein
MAIVTKFDNFVDDMLQELEEQTMEEDINLPEEELKSRALKRAELISTANYTAPLMALPHPPKAVIYLSESPLLALKTYVFHNLTETWVPTNSSPCNRRKWPIARID